MGDSIGGSGGEQSQPQNTSAVQESDFQEAADSTAVKCTCGLAKESGLLRSTTWQLTTVPLVPGDPTLLTSSGTRHIHGAHIHVQANTHRNKAIP